LNLLQGERQKSWVFIKKMGDISGNVPLALLNTTQQNTTQKTTTQYSTTQESTT
jgi:hypothetical protein